MRLHVCVFAKTLLEANKPANIHIWAVYLNKIGPHNLWYIIWILPMIKETKYIIWSKQRNTTHIPIRKQLIWSWHSSVYESLHVYKNLKFCKSLSIFISSLNDLYLNKDNKLHWNNDTMFHNISPMFNVKIPFHFCMLVIVLIKLFASCKGKVK